MHPNLKRAMDASGLPILPGSPVLGYLKRWREDPIGLLEEAAGLRTDAVWFRLGPLWALLFRHPEMVQHVLVNHQKNYAKLTKGYKKLRLVLGDGMLTSNGEFWLRQRRMAQPMFHRERLQGFVKDFSRAAVEMVEGWEPRMGQPIDVSREMMQITLRVVGETLLSTDTSHEADTVGQALTYVLGRTKNLITSVIPWEKLPTPGSYRFRDALDRLDRIVLDMIEERRNDPDPPPDLLTMFIQARDEETGEGMTDRQLRDEIMTMFLAGHETTANALAWTLYLLAQHPEAVEKLREEVDRVVGSADPSLEHLHDLTFTDAVLKEGMRLYPPVWVFGRTPLQPDEIRGVEVPTEGMVFISSYLTHRHPDVWEEANAFRPERFEPERAAAIPKGAYLPFGGGPRVCIGQHFATMEMQVILATIVQRCTFELVEGQEIVPEPMITLRPRDGVMMTIRRREAIRSTPAAAVTAN